MSPTAAEQRASAMSRRVLLVTTSLMLGGAEVQVCLLARTLAARGHRVAVVTMRDPEALAGALERDGIPLHSLGMRAGVPDPRAVVRLAAIVRRFRPSVVHSHMVHANLLARVTRLLAPVPALVSTAHSFNEGARWRELAYRFTDPLCDLTTNVCHAAVERFVVVGAVPRDRIVCVWNGIDLAAHDAQAALGGERAALGRDGAFAWLAVGNLGEAKDYPTMLRALRSVIDGGDDATLAIVGIGTGPQVRALERLLGDLCLGPDHVRYLGGRSDVPALLRAADGYVMSSAWEGLSLALLEASAERLPIVATAVGGNPEALVDGVTGVLVPSREPGALAAAMRRVMRAAPEQRQAWGDAGRAHVEQHFDIDRIVDRWEDLYAELPQARATRVGTRGC